MLHNLLCVAINLWWVNASLGLGSASLFQKRSRIWVRGEWTFGHHTVMRTTSWRTTSRKRMNEECLTDETEHVSRMPGFTFSFGLPWSAFLFFSLHAQYFQKSAFIPILKIIRRVFQKLLSALSSAQIESADDMQRQRPLLKTIRRISPKETQKKGRR